MIKRIARRTLKAFCHPDYYPDIAGDLEELYLRRKNEGYPLAGLSYLLQVLGLMRPSLMRPIKIFSFLNSNGMIRNIFKISLRTILKQRTYAAINIGGLAVSLAAFLLIQSYVRFEKSYDTQFTKADQLYRLSTHQVIDGEIKVKDAMSFNPSGKLLTEEFPEVERYTTTYRFSELVFRVDDQIISEDQIVGADEHFLDLFDYRKLHTGSNKLLQEPNSIVLTEQMALKYFGKTNALGERIYINGFSDPLQVTGVIENISPNTHFKFNAIISISTIQETLDRESWNAFNYYTYLRLSPGTDPAVLNNKIAGLTRQHLSETTTLQFTVHPVSWIHLNSDYTYETEQPGNATTIHLLGLISWFILVIAWVNYVNLATAKAMNRAKEVGIKKVVGANRRQLVLQFFAEAFIINALGAVIAILIGELAIPYFNALATIPVMTHFFNNQPTLIMLALFTVLGTLISGFYPALVLSGFNPVTVLKGTFRDSTKGVWLRKGLVLVQFVTSLVLLASTMTVYLQVQHMRQKDLGYDVSQVIGFRLPVQEYETEIEENSYKNAFLDQLRQQSNISNAAALNYLPGGGSSDVSSSSGTITIVGLTVPIQSTTYLQGVDDKALEVLKFSFLEGRNFERTMATDTSAMICNEAFLAKHNLPVSDQLLNEQVKIGTGENANSFRLIGIVKDAHRSSVKNPVEPTLYYLSDNPNNVIAKLNADNISASIEQIEVAWQQFFPQQPINYSFLDERFERLYQADKRFGTVFATFSALAIMVALFGLFGLSSYMAAQRTKEVGVRKVLGATVPQVLSIFFKQFVGLTVVAAVISGPLLYFGMSQWLNNFATRIDFPWYLIAVAMVILLLFSIITTSFQVLKVAFQNPVKALRYE